MMRLNNKSKEKHKCLPLLIIIHSHEKHFALTKIPLPYVNVWMLQLALGNVFVTAYYRCAISKQHLFNSSVGQKRQTCMHYSRKCCGGGADAVYGTLLAQRWTSCSIIQRSLNCSLYILDDVWGLFQTVLSLPLLKKLRK